MAIQEEEKRVLEKGFGGNQRSAGARPAQPRIARLHGEDLLVGGEEHSQRVADQAATHAAAQSGAEAVALVNALAARLVKGQQGLEAAMAVEQMLARARTGVWTDDPRLDAMLRQILDQEKLQAELAGQENFFDLGPDGRLRMKPPSPVGVADMTSALDHFLSAPVLSLPGVGTVHTQQVLPPSK